MKKICCVAEKFPGFQFSFVAQVKAEEQGPCVAQVKAEEQGPCTAGIVKRVAAAKPVSLLSYFPRYATDRYFPKPF